MDGFHFSAASEMERRKSICGDKTPIVIHIEPGPAGLPQPAHIPDGACPRVGAIEYALNSVMDGESRTVVDAPLADLLKGD